VCFDGIKAQSQGLRGTPQNYLAASGLQGVVKQIELISALSPFSDSGCPTLHALGWCDYESAIPQDDFLELLNAYHSSQVNAWLSARKASQANQA